MKSAPQALPGDDVVPDADLVIDRLLKLPAASAEVWPWLVQLGKGRAGWYMPAVVERWLIPAGRSGARRIEPQWQGLTVGDEVADWGGRDATLRLVAMQSPHVLVWLSTRERRSRPPLVFSWAQVLADTAAGGCELRLRLRIDLAGGRTWLARLGGGGVDWMTVTLLERGLCERLVRAAD